MNGSLQATYLDTLSRLRSYIIQQQRKALLFNSAYDTEGTKTNGVVNTHSQAMILAYNEVLRVMEDLSPDPVLLSINPTK